MDPQSSLYDPVYVSQILEPFELARQSGFAILLVMDAQQDGMPDLKCMPSASTARAWKTLGPSVAHSRDVMLELFNEPCKKRNADNQKEWTSGMQMLVDAVRGSGAQNILLLDGLDWARATNDLFPTIHDSAHDRLALAVHPYLTPAFSTVKHWHDNFGASAEKYPLIASEWNATPTNGCVGPSTPAVALSLVRYLESIKIGLIEWGIESEHGRIVKDHVGYEPTDYSTFTDCTKTPGESGGGTLLSHYPND